MRINKQIIKILITFSIYFGHPSFAQVPNTLGWHDLPNTRTDSACQFPQPNSNAGAIGCAAITSAWNGALFDTLRNRMVFGWGGGHNDYFGTEIIALTVSTASAFSDTQTLTRIRNSSPNPQSYGGAGTLSDGTPRAMHSYSNLAYLADQDKYIMITNGTSPAGDMAHQTFLWAPSTNTYTKIPTTLNYCDANWYGHALTWDGDRHLIWAFDGCSFHHFDSATNTWRIPTQSGFSDTAGSLQEANGVYDPVRKRYYLIGGGLLYYVSTKSSDQPNAIKPATSGCSGAFDGPRGAVYDPVQDRIVTWNGGNTIHLLNPSNHTCTSVTYSGGPAAVPNGTWSRFQYSKKDNLFVTCQAVNTNCKALRLTIASPDTRFTAMKNSPGVTHSQGFDNLSDYTNGVKYFNGDGGFKGADCDSSTKVSGGCSLRFNLPAGRAASNISGDWRECLKSGCVTDGDDTQSSGFGAGQTLYYQYKMRITPTMVSNLLNHWRAANNSQTGWKHANIHNGKQGSCGPLEFTGTIDTNFRDPVQIWYTQCSSPGLTASANASFGSPYYQQGNNTFSTTTNGFWCDWNVRTAGTGSGVGCFKWDWSNEWITLHGKIQFGTWNTPTSKVEIWIARENETIPYQIINVSNFNFSYGNNPVGQRTFNQISFTPYMTGLVTPAPAGANMWFDEFLVSTEPIDWPWQVTAGTGTPTAPPPANPKNLKVQ